MLADSFWENIIKYNRFYNHNYFGKSKIVKNQLY